MQTVMEKPVSIVQYPIGPSWITYYNTEHNMYTSIRSDRITQLSIKPLDNDPDMYRILAWEIDGCGDSWVIHPASSNIAYLKEEMIRVRESIRNQIDYEVVIGVNI